MGSFREFSRCLRNEGYINVERKMGYLNYGLENISLEENKNISPKPLIKYNNTIKNKLGVLYGKS